MLQFSLQRLMKALCDTDGCRDLLAGLCVETKIELSRVLERMRLIKGIANSETSILLDSCR